MSRLLIATKRTQAVLDFERGKAEKVAEIKRDFPGGKKSNRVQYLNKEDCR